MATQTSRNRRHTWGTLKCFVALASNARDTVRGWVWGNMNTNDSDSGNVTPPEWVLSTPMGVRVLEFTSYTATDEYEPWAILSVDGMECLIKGFGSIHSLLNCCFRDEPLEEGPLWDAMMYSQEPFVYDFRRLMGDSDVQYIGFKLERGGAVLTTAHLLPYSVFVISDVIGLIEDGEVRF